MVSIIIPAYNAEKYIKCAVDSVICQSYRDLQIIVIDDGSTDRTYEVLSGLAQIDKRITVIQKENGGVSSARNLALKRASGEYILFLDSDDYLEENAIEIFVNKMEESGADWVSSQYSRWDEEGTRLEDYNFIEGERLFNSDEERLEFLTDELLPYLVGFEVWGKLFRTDIIRDNEISFSEKCRIGEDLAFNIKYLMHSEKLRCISDRCVRYTIRNDSAMGELKDLSKIISEDIYLLKDIHEYMEEKEKKLFIDKFSLICAKLFGNSYIGHTPLEVAKAVKGTESSEYLIEQYLDFKQHKDEILALFPDSIRRIKYRYHMYILGYLSGFSVSERIEIFIYNLYRRLRRRPILENWVMPY